MSPFFTALFRGTEAGIESASGRLVGVLVYDRDASRD